jgi:drug/metabolite transporter (DMT)-like permease
MTTLTEKTHRSGIAFNLAAPLQQRRGVLSVMWRAQIVALVLLTPLGLAGLPESRFAWSSLLAVAALGCLGTAFAFVALTTLVGRVGSTRASVTVYFLPAVAIVGVVFGHETIAAASLLGTALVTAGAYLTSRAEAAGASSAETENSSIIATTTAVTSQEGTL